MSPRLQLIASLNDSTCDRRFRTPRSRIRRAATSPVNPSQTAAPWWPNNYRPAAIASSRATRSAVGGWVLNSLAIPPPCAASGFTWASGAAAGATCIGIRRAIASSRTSAWASGIGRPRIWAPTRSASNSRWRDTAIWISIAPIGAQQEQGDLGEGMAALVVAPAAEEEQVGQVAERAGDARRHGGDQHVAVLDVRQLVRDHAFQLLRRHVLEDARGDRDDRLLRAAPGGEGVGLLVRRHRHDRHRQPGPLPQAIHHPVQLRGLGLGDHVGAVHPEHQAVGEEVHHEVEEPAEDQGEHQPLGAAEQLPGQAEQADQGPHQNERLDVVHTLLYSRTTPPPGG